MEHLQKAFAFDIHVRRDVDEKFSADLLIHEVGMSKQDPRLAGPLDERLPNGRGTRRQLRSIVEHHTDPSEAGMIFEKVLAGEVQLAVGGDRRCAEGSAAGDALLVDALPAADVVGG